MDGVTRDVNEISRTNGNDFVVQQMGEATLKHVDPLLIIGVGVRRRCFAGLVGYNANFNELAPELHHHDIRVHNIWGRLHVLSLVERD